MTAFLTASSLCLAARFGVPRQFTCLDSGTRSSPPGRCVFPEGRRHCPLDAVHPTSLVNSFASLAQRARNDARTSVICGVCEHFETSSPRADRDALTCRQGHAEATEIGDAGTSPPGCQYLSGMEHRLLVSVVAFANTTGARNGRLCGGLRQPGRGETRMEPRKRLIRGTSSREWNFFRRLAGTEPAQGHERREAHVIPGRGGFAAARNLTATSTSLKLAQGLHCKLRARRESDESIVRQPGWLHEPPDRWAKRFDADGLHPPRKDKAQL